MQTKRNNSGYEMTLLPPLEQLIPKDHSLRRLNQVLDLGFVHEAVRDLYCQDNGRPSIDPEVIIRLFLLKAIYNIPSFRRLMEDVAVNLAYRWFIGYRVDESLPDHSTLSRAFERFGDGLFNELLKRSVEQCKKSGLIEGKVLHIDATTIRADLDANRVDKPDSPDPDARFGRFPDGKKRPGYKQHTIADGKSRVIVGLRVTPANRFEHGEAIPLLDEVLQRLEEVPESVCGDTAYASGKNYMEVKERGARLVSPPSKARTYTGDKYYSVEDFVYDEEKDLFVCPGNRQLRCFATAKGGSRRVYRARPADCRRCPLKPRCTKSDRRYVKVSAHHAGLVQLRADSKTENFRKVYASRAPVIEGVFGEAKQRHGLRRAWRRGLSKMKVQCLLIAAVMNFKRLAALFIRLFGIKRGDQVLISVFSSYLAAVDIRKRSFCCQEL